jgi:hypothetical protein
MGYVACGEWRTREVRSIATGFVVLFLNVIADRRVRTLVSPSWTEISHTISK